MTVAPNSVDRVIRYCAGSTSGARADSGRQRTTSLTAPAGYDRAPGTRPHPQAESMHPCATPIVRLECPLALGHGCISSLRLATTSARRHLWQPLVSSAVLLRNRRAPHDLRGDRSGSQPYRRLPGDCSRVLTRIRWVKPANFARRRSRGVPRIPPRSRPSWVDPSRTEPRRPQQRLPRLRSDKNVSINVAERLALRDKTVSFWQCRSHRDGADSDQRQQGCATTRATRQTFAGRLSQEDSRPIHICG